MKPFAGIDLTLDKKNTKIAGNAFLCATPSPAMAQTLSQASQKVEVATQAAKLPLALRIIQMICCFLGFTFAIGLFKGLGDVTIEEAYGNAPWIFWGGGAFLLIWGILTLMAKQKEKKVLSGEESSRAFSNLESISRSVYTELGVTEATQQVDVLGFYCKCKDSKIKLCTQGTQTAPYLNFDFYAFSDAENLYLVNLDGKYAIPIRAIKQIHTIKKSASFTGWNKKQLYDEGIYAQYKLTTDKYNRIHSKYFHILEFAHDDQSWGIYFPCYELPTFEKLTGLQAHK